MVEQNWRCNDCQRCMNCRSQMNKESLLICQKCNTPCHYDCLTPEYKACLRPFAAPNTEDEEGAQQSESCIMPQKFKCEACIKCQNCGATRAGDKKGQKWSKDFKFCASCNKKRDKK